MTAEKKPRAPRKPKSEATDAVVKNEQQAAPFDGGTPVADAPAADLVVLDAKQQALVAFKPQMDLLADFKKRFGPNVVVQYDLTTTAGDKAARADRLELVTARTSIEKRRKALNEADQDRITVRNTVAKEVINEMAPYEDAVDALIKADEKRRADEKAAAEALRREAEEKVSNDINTIRNVLVEMTGKTSAEIGAAEQALREQEITTEAFGNRYGEAISAKDYVMRKLAEMGDATRNLEEREEAARLAAEQRDREARERAEQQERDRAAEEEKRARERREDEERQARIRQENEDRAAALAQQEKELADRRAALLADEEAARKKREEAEQAERDKREQAEREARELLQRRRDDIGIILATTHKARIAATSMDAQGVYDALADMPIHEGLFGELTEEAGNAKRTTLQAITTIIEEKAEAEARAVAQKRADDDARAEREAREREEAKQAALRTKKQAMADRMFDALVAVAQDPAYASLDGAVVNEVQAILTSI